jgi:transcriptional repressor NrdR
MEELDIVVIKRDGREQEYDRTKIERGLVRAFQKRPNAHAKIERVLANIEHVLKNKKQRKVKSREVGRIILQELRRSDQVAYVRFASVYKSFGSAESFRKEIEKILE